MLHLLIAHYSCGCFLTLNQAQNNVQRIYSAQIAQLLASVLKSTSLLSNYKQNYANLFE